MAGIDIFPQVHSDDIYRRFSNRIFNCSAIGANAIRKARAGASLRDDAWVSILFEFLFFYVALAIERGLIESAIDRRARVVKKLTELLIPAAVDYMLDDGKGDNNESLKTHMLTQCRERAETYKKCAEFLPSSAKDKKNTALTVLCMRVSELAGESGDTALVVTSQAHILDSVELLDLDIFAAMAGK